MLHKGLSGIPRGNGEGAIKGVVPALLFTVKHAGDQQDAVVAVNVVKHIVRAVELVKAGVNRFSVIRWDLFAKLLEHGPFFVERPERATDDVAEGAIYHSHVFEHMSTQLIVLDATANELPAGIGDHGICLAVHSNLQFGRCR